MQLNTGRGIYVCYTVEDGAFTNKKNKHVGTTAQSKPNNWRGQIGDYIQSVLAPIPKRQINDHVDTDATSSQRRRQVDDGLDTVSD